MLRWIVELGRIDIAFEVALLSKFLALPRTGHLAQALRVFKYLDCHKTNEIAMDPAYHVIMDKEEMEQKINEMKQLYVDSKEELPPNAPDPRGMGIQVNAFVDADHAGDPSIRRSQTGVLLYCNSAPILWYSKQQSTIESSTFGSEFVALRICSELIISLRYKLRMFGIPVIGPANVFCDNESVYNNATRVSAQLRKKHNSICFHRVRECVASGILFVHKVDSKHNLADLLTKGLASEKRIFLRKRIMVDDTSM